MFTVPCNADRAFWWWPKHVKVNFYVMLSLLYTWWPALLIHVELNVTSLILLKARLSKMARLGNTLLARKRSHLCHDIFFHLPTFFRRPDFTSEFTLHLHIAQLSGSFLSLAGTALNLERKICWEEQSLFTHISFRPPKEVTAPFPKIHGPHRKRRID